MIKIDGLPAEWDVASHRLLVHMKSGEVRALTLSAARQLWDRSLLVVAGVPPALLRTRKRNPLLANPTYRAVLDSDASPRAVKKMLAAAGFGVSRVRTVKGTGKKKAPGAYAQFVKQHMAEFKGRMSAPEAMKAIGALWRERGAKSNPVKRRNHWLVPLAVGVPAGMILEAKTGAARRAMRVNPIHANPSDKQVSYALYLLDKAGYSTRYMNASFKKLGARMSERSGTVADWLRGMNGPEISNLIDRLKS